MSWLRMIQGRLLKQILPWSNRNIGMQQVILPYYSNGGNQLFYKESKQVL